MLCNVVSNVNWCMKNQEMQSIWFLCCYAIRFYVSSCFGGKRLENWCNVSSFFNEISIPLSDQCIHSVNGIRYSPTWFFHQNDQEPRGGWLKSHLNKNTFRQTPERFSRFCVSMCYEDKDRSVTVARTFSEKNRIARRKAQQRLKTLRSSNSSKNLLVAPRKSMAKPLNVRGWNGR